MQPGIGTEPGPINQWNGTEEPDIISHLWKHNLLERS